MIIFYLDPAGVVEATTSTLNQDEADLARQFLLLTIHNLENLGFQVGIIITSVKRNQAQDLKSLRALYQHLGEISAYIIGATTPQRKTLFAPEQAEIFYRGAHIAAHWRDIQQSNNAKHYETFFVLDENLGEYTYKRRLFDQHAKRIEVNIDRVALRGLDTKFHEHFVGGRFNEASHEQIISFVKTQQLKPCMIKLYDSLSWQAMEIVSEQAFSEMVRVERDRVKTWSNQENNGSPAANKQQLFQQIKKDKTISKKSLKKTVDGKQYFQLN